MAPPHRQVGKPREVEMWVWILVGVAVLALGVFAFWPRRRGITDGDLGRKRSRTEDQVRRFQNRGNNLGPRP